MANGAPAGSGVGGVSTTWYEKGGVWTKAGGKGAGTKPKPDSVKGQKPNGAKGSGKQTEAKVPTIVDGFDISQTFPVATGGVWMWGKNKKRWHLQGALRVPKEESAAKPPDSKPPSAVKQVRFEDGDETPKGVDLQKTLADLKAYLVQQKIFGDDTSKTEMLISETQGQIDRAYPPEVRLRSITDKLVSADKKTSEAEILYKEAAQVLSEVTKAFETARDAVTLAKDFAEGLRKEKEVLLQTLGSQSTPSVKQAMCFLQTVPKENWYQPEAIASSNMLLEQAFMHLLSTTELAQAHVPNFSNSMFSRIMATGAFPRPPPPPDVSVVPGVSADDMEVGDTKRSAENQLIPDDPDECGLQVHCADGNSHVLHGKGQGPPHQ
jgi:hypothetical protein